MLKDGKTKRAATEAMHEGRQREVEEGDDVLEVEGHQRAALAAAGR